MPANGVFPMWQTVQAGYSMINISLSNYAQSRETTLEIGPTNTINIQPGTGLQLSLYSINGVPLNQITNLMTVFQYSTSGINSNGGTNYFGNLVFYDLNTQIPYNFNYMYTNNIPIN